MSDPWRWRCPNGHTAWENTAAVGYRCTTCGESFSELEDARDLDGRAGRGSV